ncbi:hypothetical protein [Candidatus Liberibacter americanus]|uniref:DUF177 domain-containing protein n=1 Tax=Candidatus Liberibacter americanus str. Sao Paulo TaxID=1261131 RepID=U6B7E4_9HYPH|nr:hypothetical protein [Candidatus Liberibacter americanus]AHA27776.1 hypothetical protein lam_409 [Candidatus Liberibacter americanus str. Sao Paulo]EMS36161.1 hypothetical protein G653_02911 [Candidatus Liberibacter americanus PW_SP]
MGKSLDITEKFSRIINVKSVFSSPMKIKIEANRFDCENLAKQWEVSAVESLYADIKLSKWKRIGVRVEGTVYAKIIQVCVITLEPLTSYIEESLGCVLVPNSSKLLLSNYNCSGKNEFEIKGVDIIGFAEDGTIDIGFLVSDFAALAINPYPKKEGSVFSDIYNCYDK